MYSDIKLISGCLGLEGGWSGGKDYKEQEETLGVICMFSVLILVMILQLYINVKTYPIEYLNMFNLYVYYENVKFVVSLLCVLDWI